MAPPVAVVAAPVSFGVLPGTLSLGHGVEFRPPVGLPWSGSGTTWALSSARMLCTTCSGCSPSWSRCQ